MNPQDILKSAQSFMECRILLTAAEMNLFSILKDSPLTAEDVAAKTGSNLRALTMVLDALAAMELLTKENGTYRCADAAVLSDDAPNSVLPMIRHMASLWHRWSHLTDIVKNVEGAKKEFEFFRKPEEMRAFIGAMHVVSGPLARKTAAVARAESSRALLDVGGGSGSYTIALKAVPEMKATIFDLPDVIEMSRERLQEEGLLGRTTLVAGDFYEQELPAGADLDLYSKAFRALTPRGRILIRDHVMEPDRARPRGGAIFAINMLVGTDGGGTYTYKEIENDLTAAGFVNVRLIQQGEQMDAIVEAFKP